MAKTQPTKVHSVAGSPAALEARLDEVEKLLGLLTRVPSIALSLKETALREQLELQQRASEERQQAERAAQESIRRRTFQRFVEERVAIHPSLAVAPVAPWKAFLDWCFNNNVPAHQRPDEGEFRQWLLEVPGVTWGPTAILNSVGRTIGGFMGFAISDDPAAELQRIEAEQEQQSRARLQRDASTMHDLQAREEAFEARRERDEGLRVLARQEAAGSRR